MNARYATAESFATLTVGLWSVALIGYLSAGITAGTYFLVVVGALCALFALYLVLPTGWRQGLVSKRMVDGGYLRMVKSVGWLTVGLLFGVRLVQSGVVWLVVTGLITMIVAFVVFYIAMFRSVGK